MYKFCTKFPLLLFKQPIVFYFFFNSCISSHIFYVFSNDYSSYNSLPSCIFIFIIFKNFPQYFLTVRNTIGKLFLLLLVFKNIYYPINLFELTLNDLQRSNYFCSLIEKERNASNIIMLESYFHWQQAYQGVNLPARKKVTQALLIE